MGGIVFVLPLFMMAYAQRQYVARTQQSIQETQRMNQELALANQQVIAASQAIRQLNDELFLTLGKIIDARDPYVSGHASKVAEYAEAIAKEMAMPKERIELVRQAALLHDIGKIGISEWVLNKPSTLGPEERSEIQNHSSIGADFLQACHGLHHLASFIRHHHERWDGRGYPDRLQGEQIPVEARILSVCDAVEAMASDRPYREAMSLEAVIREMRLCAGSQFDPKIVDAFVQVVRVKEGQALVVNSAQHVLRSEASNGARRNRLNGSHVLRNSHVTV
jgi:putative nucleotidyltransferase with HDIG domain